MTDNTYGMITEKHIRVEPVNYIVLYPNYANIYDIYHYIKHKDQYDHSRHSRSYISSYDKDYELSGRHNGRIFLMMYHNFDRSLTGILMRGNYFIAKFDNNTFFDEVRFSLDGFSKALSVYNEQCP